jgi:methylmalonyl-CoA mutase C-terminal domain/subunit
VVNVALQEDVDAVLVSVHSGAHDVLLPRIMTLLAENGATDKVVFAGGIIPEEDIEALKSCGVKEVSGPGTTMTEVARLVRQYVKK